MRDWFAGHGTLFTIAVSGTCDVHMMSAAVEEKEAENLLGSSTEFVVSSVIPLSHLHMISSEVTCPMHV